jgi:ABC-type transport system involved in cytochrome c biogenesis permease subunit
MRKLLPVILLAFAAPVLAHAQAPAPAAEMAVQDGGRVKPLATFARYTLLQASGRTSFETEDGTRLGALDWLWECLFQPEQAFQRKVFLIESAEAMDALGLAHDAPRDRFSYNALAPYRDTLANQARQYAAIDKEHRSPAQEQLLRLMHNMHQFERLVAFANASAAPISVPEEIASAHDLPTQAQLSEILLAEELLWDRGGTMQRPANTLFLSGLSQRMGQATALSFIPSRAAPGEAQEWRSPSDLFERARQGMMPDPAQLAILETWEVLVAARGKPIAMAEQLATLNDQVRDFAGDYRQLRQIPLENHLYRIQPFFWSLLGYLFAFLLIALSWLAPRNRILYAAGVFALTVPLALHNYGIVLRCIIRARPPVSTLYETILFVSAVAVACGLITELINRRRIGVVVAAVLGAIGLFLANKYELVERGDTMPALIAVLDTNFWLSTHVTTITVGYAAGLLSGAIAHVYLIGKALGWRKNDHVFYKSLTRMVYGVLCFEILFATVGTILGGIWANESWGRFWGWDPKENGALMIVLWGLAVMHARLGGYIRDFGVNMAAVFGAIIVAFSWFGVNLLGVGLHSYGFTSGVYQALVTFYVFECCILTIGAIGWFRDTAPDQKKTAPEETSSGAGESSVSGESS